MTIETIETSLKADVAAAGNVVHADVVVAESLFSKVVTAYTSTWIYWLPAIVVAGVLGHVI